MSLANFAGEGEQNSSEEVVLRLMNVESDSYYGKPMIRLFGRDSNRVYHHVEVMGLKPSLYVRKSDYNNRIENHFAVDKVEAAVKTTVYGEELVKIYSNSSKQLNTVEELFEQTYEADVDYSDKFLLEEGVMTTVAVDTSQAETLDGKIRVDVDDVRAVDEQLSVDPRTITVDIEVSRTDGFPHASKATWPVITIVGHDNYSGERKVSCLWDGDMDMSPAELHEAIEEQTDPFKDNVQVFIDESQMLNDFMYWVSDLQPDVLGGWSSNNFDWPYLLNRSTNLTNTSHREISPVGEVWVSDWNGEPSGSGITFFDFLQAYEKTQYHSLRSKALDYVAENELGRGKLDLHALEGAPKSSSVIYTWAWKNDPVTFVDYNIRDVMAVVEIDNEVGVTHLFNHLRNISGATLDSLVGNNIKMIDHLILNHAEDEGIALPTSTKPDEDWFFGAYVFQPRAGLHEHVVYPDYASLYPNQMVQCNMSPETIVGTEAELIMSEYSKDDCVWSYVDLRPVARVETGSSYEQYKNGSYKAVMRQKKNGGWKTVWFDDPDYQKMYFLKPEVKQGFVSAVVDELLTMKYEYKGTEQYTAVKQVCNSIYGVFGDSNSFGTGFRLFDWRIAEAITLGGRKMIKNGAEVFNNAAKKYGAEEAYLVGGDTDSIMTALPDSTDDSEAVRIADKAAEEVNEWHDTYCTETFGVEEHRMDLEVESYSPRCLFVQDQDEDDGVGKKKRYVTIITREDGKELDEPELNIKGFEAIRSDKAQITMDSQELLFNLLMTEDLEDAKEQFIEYLDETVNGEMGLEMLGTPFGIRKELPEYFGEHRAMPWYRGAMWANENIYNSSRIQKNVDAMYYYVDSVGEQYNQTFGERTGAGADDPVSCVAVVDTNDLDDSIELNMEKILEKTLKNPLKPITDTLGWEWDEISPQ